MQGQGSLPHSPVGRGSPLISPLVVDLDRSHQQVPEDVYRLAFLPLFKGCFFLSWCLMQLSDILSCYFKLSSTAYLLYEWSGVVFVSSPFVPSSSHYTVETSFSQLCWFNAIYKNAVIFLVRHWQLLKCRKLMQPWQKICLLGHVESLCTY
jgi:hypothetical protein